MSEEKQYRQLALFSTIVAEVVITPCGLGGLTYYLTRNLELQMPLSLLAGLAGLIIAFYRINLLRKTMDENK